jgi:hypothetical protein
VLLRALRDFNLGKLTADDTGIFMGLLNDLFPKTLELVPRAVEKEFESRVRARPGRLLDWQQRRGGAPAGLAGCRGDPLSRSCRCLSLARRPPWDGLNCLP